MMLHISETATAEDIIVKALLQDGTTTSISLKAGYDPKDYVILNEQFSYNVCVTRDISAISGNPRGIYLRGISEISGNTRGIYLRGISAISGNPLGIYLVRNKRLNHTVDTGLRYCHPLPEKP